MTTLPAREIAREFVRRFGRDVVAWQGLESACEHWFADDACVAYVDTGSAWVAAGSPWCEAGRTAAIAQAFVAAARERGRRACFFGAEQPGQLTGQGAMLLGEQPMFEPALWPEKAAKYPRLKEQLRRARAKGVQVRRVEAEELAAGAPLRQAVDALAEGWLRARHLEPMGFLLTLEPWLFAADHRYYAAERDGRVMAFCSLVPVPARRGWLVEDLFRDRCVPNGTTELLLDAAIRDAAGDAFVSLGLAPLSGPVSPVLLAARAIGAPLFDFRSLRAFKQRLHPDRWEQVWLVHPPRRAVVALIDSLRAFARGSLIAFGWHSIVRRPSGAPWLLAVPLVPWTMFLALLIAFDDGQLLGFGRPALCAWVLWDAMLALLLFRTARRPRRSRLVWLSCAAALDAVLSALHIVRVGVGHGLFANALRLAGMLAPIGATVALAWAGKRAPPPN